MNIETVNELIQSLESAGELSIKERKYLELAKAYQQLAAENVALKDLARGWANATDDRLFEEFGEICHDSIDDCEAELKTICPATDRIVAEAEARGVEKFVAEQRGVAERLKKRGGDLVMSSIKFCLESAEEAEVFAQQLREGADK